MKSLHDQYQQIEEAVMVAGGGFPSPRAQSAIGSAHARDRRDENPEGVESAHAQEPR